MWAGPASTWISSWRRWTWTGRAISTSPISSSAGPLRTGTPLPQEQEACIGWLRNQFALLRPKILVCLGRVAAMKLIKPDIKITKEHGEFLEKNGVLMMATLHPAALLRNPNQKPAAFEDFLKLREKMDELAAIERRGERVLGTLPPKRRPLRTS